MELQVIEQNVIVAAYATQGGTDELYERIAQEARSFVPDVTTKKGRDAIGSLAMKVSKSKTLIEKYGKELVAEQKAKIKLVDDDRIAVVKKLDALRDEILAPRDAWEQAEKDRVAKHESNIASIRDFAEYDFESSKEIESDISELEKWVIDSSYEEYEEQAKLAKFETLEKLRKALAEREKYEAEQAELERLRKAEQERLQQQYEEQLKAQAAEKARLEAESKAKAEQEKLERERLAAEQAQKRAEAEKEAAELRAKEAERQAVIAAQQERERIEREQAAQAEAERQAEAARLADVEHRRTINNAILSKLMEIGLDEEQGKEVIAALAKNQVPHVSIKY